MTKIFCPYCGEPLKNDCNCEVEAAIEKDELIEKVEEWQHDSGFYAFQDLMDMCRRER